jgi:CDP-diglyceride synthetase
MKYLPLIGVTICAFLSGISLGTVWGLAPLLVVAFFAEAGAYFVGKNL